MFVVLCFTCCVVSFRGTTHLVTEGGTLTITTQVYNPSNSPNSVRVLGTRPPSLIITIPTGEISVTFEFPTIKDSICEDDEIVTLTLDELTTLVFLL